MIRGRQGIRFRGPKMYCLNCDIRPECLRKPDKTEARQVVFFTGNNDDNKATYKQRMNNKFDSKQGRSIYSSRIGAVEPVFANIRRAIGLDRFTLRGKKKVDIQWKLNSIVHNLLKVHRLRFT
jgi:DDE family transposase